MAVDLDAFFQESLVPWSHGILEAQDYLDTLAQGAKPGYGTGLVSLDNHMRFLPRELVVIGARAGVGKTALGMQLCENVARQMHAAGDSGLIAVFSAEMDSRTLALRMACGLEKVPLWKVQNGEAKPHELAQIRGRLAKMMRLPFVVDQSPAPTLTHMGEQLSIYAEDRPLRLVLFDYTELAGEWAKQESLRVAQILRGLKAIAKKFDTTVLALSQLNRSIESRLEKRPRLSDLMHGGEREPDRILTLVCDEDKTERIWCYGIKNRNAPQFEAVLLFDGPNMRFKSAAIHNQDLSEKRDE